MATTLGEDNYTWTADSPPEGLPSSSPYEDLLGLHPDLGHEPSHPAIKGGHDLDASVSDDDDDDDDNESSEDESAASTRNHHLKGTPPVAFVAGPTRHP